MESDNAILGDNSPIDIPQTVVQNEDLTTERNMAKFSRTAEYKRLKDYILSRIEFWQTFIPTGLPNDKASDYHWGIANQIIAEFRLILASYEQAEEAVRNADTQRA